MKGTLRWLALIASACVALAPCRPSRAEVAPTQPSIPPRPLPHAVATEPVSGDADDLAIWIHPTDPGASRVIATDKAKGPRGSLVVYDLAGRIVQRIDGLHRPNNVDVRRALRLSDRTIDVAVATERDKRRLLVYRIRPEDGWLQDIASPGGTEVFANEPGERGAPMGVALYRRPSDGTVYAFVSRKQGPASGYLWQYRLEDDGQGRVRIVKLRELGTVLEGNEVEAIVCDDGLGHVYYAEEGRGIHKWPADPDDTAATSELALFGTTGFKGEREGLAIWARENGSGYVVASDQIPGGSRYFVFRRGGGEGRPHDHSEVVALLEGGADDTDGIEAACESLGPRFPRGMLGAMNSIGRNFLLYDWRALGLK